MENVTLKPKEQTRLQVLNSLLAEHMTLDQAATLMGVSPRHTRRILADYRKHGAASLAHGHRGRKPANAIPETTRSRVVHLARTVYEGANHTHLSELLSEREGLDMGRTTLRCILVNVGLSSPRRRRPPKHRVHRQRMPREGMLVQMDGSYHRWLGEDGPQFTILFAVDDATGCVPGALFCDHEDTSSYFLLMQGLIRRRGIPLALYTDRHAVFKHRSEYQPAGTPTQFGRAMEELGTQLIFALSPQAKGRVERTAGTFQDRLVSELRLVGVATIDRATPCCGTSCPASTTSSACLLNSPSPPIVPWTPPCIWNGSSASSTCARWPGTTPSSTSCAPCSCFQPRTGPAMPVSLSHKAAMDLPKADVAANSLAMGVKGKRLAGQPVVSRVGDYGMSTVCPLRYG